MNKEKKIIYTAIFLIILLFFFLPKSIMGAFFRLEPKEISKKVNETFTIDVFVDSGNEEIRSVDIYLNFDNNLITFDSFTPGNFFSTVAHNLNPNNNELYIFGIMDDVSIRSGSGKVASVSFKGKSQSSGMINFSCEKSVIVKADANATNILVCSSNIPAKFIISTSSNSETPTNSTSNNPGSGQNSASNTSNSSTSSSSRSATNPSPKTLPKSGFMDRMKNLTILGLTLISLSGLLKVISIKL